MKVQTDNSCPPPIFLEEITKLTDFFGVYLTVYVLHYQCYPLWHFIAMPPTLSFEKLRKLRSMHWYLALQNDIIL